MCMRRDLVCISSTLPVNSKPIPMPSPKSSDFVQWRVDELAQGEIRSRVAQVRTTQVPLGQEAAWDVRMDNTDLPSSATRVFRPTSSSLTTSHHLLARRRPLAPLGSPVPKVDPTSAFLCCESLHDMSRTFWQPALDRGHAKNRQVGLNVVSFTWTCPSVRIFFSVMLSQHRHF